MPTFTRRSALVAGGTFVGAGLVSRGLRPWVPAARAAEAEADRHGLSVFGELALPPDFAHLPYVNPAAPKGGEIRLQTTSTGGNQNFTTFDTLNIFILKGNGAAGMSLIFDTLMTGSLDEPDALYGLVAKTVRWSPDKLTYTFTLRPEARFHDGSPLTAADVVFSLTTLRDRGHPVIRTTLRHLKGAMAPDAQTVVVTLDPAHSRELPLVVAGQPIFSKSYYDKHPFDETTLEPPLGSSNYKVGPFEQGRYISFNRVDNYWAKDLPINVGQGNFDTVRYEYFRERQVGFEGFKSGVTTFQEDATSINWARGYDFPAVKDGRVKKETIADQSPRSVQAWWYNIRRPQFRDPRIREALRYAFDFQWTNQNIMFGLYQRTWSYFQNTDMAAKGAPSPEELALLETFRGKVPDIVFGDAVMPPVSDGSGQDRALLSQAFKLLTAAGCKRDGNVLKLPSGEPFRLEFLDFQGALERHTAPFIKNLKLLGIDATYRVVDSAQYQSRFQSFDFDITVVNHSGSFTPGEDLRVLWGSEAAKTPGSQNIVGVADPVLDALIEKALVAGSRPELTTICRCIDRVLRSGFYGIFMWNNPVHWYAYWNIFDRPQVPPKYDPGVLSTWWVDPAKAKAVRIGP